VACRAAKDCGVDLSRVLIIKSSPEWSMRSVVEGGKMALPSSGKMDWEKITDQKMLEESLICLLYSSGTTGIPKGKGINFAEGDVFADQFQVLCFHTRILCQNVTFRLQCGGKIRKNERKEESPPLNTEL
jgi:hypothetical protein